MLWTIEDVCKFLKSDEPTVLFLIEQGHLPPPVNIGEDRLVRWISDDLLAWARMGCPQFAAPTEGEFVTIRERHIEEKYTLEEINAMQSDRRDNDRINAGAEWTPELPIPDGYQRAE